MTTAGLALAVFLVRPARALRPAGRTYSEVKVLYERLRKEKSTVEPAMPKPDPVPPPPVPKPDPKPLPIPQKSS